MKKSYRVKRDQDFQAVFHKGKSVANRQFVVYSLERETTAHYRVGISVSKKLGNAVVRNSLKRKIRHLVMELGQDLAKRDFIIIARQPIKTMSYPEMKKSLVHVLTLATILPKTTEESGNRLEKES